MLEQSPGNFGNARVPYDWYQNVTHVIITVRIANLKENDVKVTIINDALDVMCQLMDGRQFRMHFNLYKTVMVAESNWAVDTSKLVINLRKNDRKRWHSLETIPDRTGVKPKSFIGIVNIREAKNELSNLLSATEFADGKDSAGGSGKDSDGPGSTAITITRTRNNSGNSRAAGDGQVEDDSLIESSQDPISLDYNWYQTDHYINLVIHVPNIKVTEGRSFLFYEDDINIILTDNTLNWICNFPTGVTNVNFKLYREINSNDSRYEISPCRTKIEIKLRKLDESYWPSFVMEGDEEVEEVVETTAGGEGEGEGEEVVSVEENGGESDGVKQNNGQTESAVAAAVVVVATKSGAVKPAEPAAGKAEHLVEDGENDQAPPLPSVATTNSAKIKPTPSAPSTRLQAAAH